ncbi:MAG: hypothetical protein HRU75_13865 [Planctomycetia bacterium]|nr:MAG: hypothetical protein HRU75_13865 [Planctomycetia bacterium]
MALTADRDVDYFASADSIELGVDAEVVIYKGAFVGRNRTTNYARPLTAGDEFVGVALGHCDHSAVGAVAGAKRVRVQQVVDIVHGVPFSGASDVGRPVFASDDGTLTLSPAGGSRVGRIVSWESAASVRVRCGPIGSLSGILEGFAATTLGDASATLAVEQMNRVLFIANTAARTLTLPAAASCRAGAWFALVKTSAAAFAVTLDPNGSETIDGQATFGGVDAAYDTVIVVCTGAEWVILARDIA